MRQLAATHEAIEMITLVPHPPFPLSPSCFSLPGVGFVTPEMIAEHFGAPGDDILVVVCGPPGMCKAMCGHLDALGFERGVNYYSYL